MADSAKRILVVDDEAPILDAVSYALRKEGFRVAVAANAEACMRQYREEQPDLVVLDVMLPSASGLEVCRTIRSVSKTPIILLTARAEERDKVMGLELGADDYVTKPFSVRELVARVKAILRRSIEGAPASTVLEAGDLVIDESKHEVKFKGHDLALSPKEFALLTFFVRNRGLAFSRQTLLDRVWGAEAYVDERTVDVHVHWLRAKIEVTPTQPKKLVTVRGIGYKFLGEGD